MLLIATNSSLESPQSNGWKKVQRPDSTVNKVNKDNTFLPLFFLFSFFYPFSAVSTKLLHTDCDIDDGGGELVGREE